MAQVEQGTITLTLNGEVVLDGWRLDGAPATGAEATIAALVVQRLMEAARQMQQKLRVAGLNRS